MMHGRAVAWLPAELRLRLLEVVPRLSWRDGSSTAQGLAASVKDCQVADTVGDAALSTQEGAGLLAETRLQIFQSLEFVESALPFRVTPLRFVRYGRGGSYGVHTDAPFNESAGFRADMSFTVLLQAADSGGRLFVDGVPVDMREGEVFLYPATTAHGVSVVEGGERIVLVGWVQSVVRDHAKRALLARLHRMVSNSEQRDAVSLQAVRNELLRMWCG